MPKIQVRSFSKGCGFGEHDPDGYGIGIGVDTRSGKATPGLEPTLNDGGILASAYKDVKRIVHNLTNWLVQTDGTNTKVYRINAGIWQLRNTFDAGYVNGAKVATDMISFTNVTDDYVIIFFGAKKWEYSVDDGASWVENDQAAVTTRDPAYGKYACVQRANRTAPQIAYVTDPNILYFTATPGVGLADSTTSTTIDDANANSSYFTSATENDAGVLLIGKRYELFSVDSAGAVISVGGPYPDITGDAGGAVAALPLDAKNFANPVHLDGRQYYIVQGYDVFEYDHGVVGLIAPYRRGDEVIPYPHVRRPITALCAFDGELWVALSSTRTTYFTDAFSLNPIVGPVGAFAQLYAGHRTDTGWVWHGSLWQASVQHYVRYMWYDPAFQLLYFGTDDATNSQYVAFVPHHGAVDQLSNATGSPVSDFGTAWTLTLGAIEVDSGESLSPGRLRMVTTGLGSISATSPTIQAALDYYKGNAGRQFTTQTFASDALANYGCTFPSSIGGSRLILSFIGAASATSKPAILHSASLEVDDLEKARIPAGIL